ICAEGRNLSHAISRRTNAARARKAAARVVIAPARLKTPEIGSARFDVSKASSHNPTDALAVAAEPAYTANATDSHRNALAIPVRTTPNVGVSNHIDGPGAESTNMIDVMMASRKYPLCVHRTFGIPVRRRQRLPGRASPGERAAAWRKGLNSLAPSGTALSTTLAGRGTFGR